jgi:uncharacterized delta-60 repeat protein
MAFRLPIIPGGAAGSSISAELDIRFTRLDSDGTRNPITLTNPTAFPVNLAQIKNYVQNSTLTLSMCLNGPILAIAVQSDGKILIGGFFGPGIGEKTNRLIRLNADGTEDTAFTTNLGTGFSGPVYAIAVQSDGKILVGGGFTTFGANTRGRMLRLNADGTDDTTFNNNMGGGGFNNTVFDIAIQSNDQIVVGGSFTVLGSGTRNRLVRFNSNGTVDTTFYANLGGSGSTSAFNGTVFAVAIQSDQKILVGGSFSSLGGTTRNRMVRLNTTGTVDTAFYGSLGSGAFNNTVREITVQSDQKILVGGEFTSLGGTTRNRLVRLNDGGTVDTAFYTNLGTGFVGPPNIIVVQSDAKILVGGEFTGLGANTRNYMLRLNADGTEDTTFYTNLGGLDGVVNYIALESTGKIFVGGGFGTN